MKQGDVITFVTTTLGELQPSADLSQVAADSTLTDLGIDSAAIIQAVVICEDHFDIMLPDEVLESVTTMGGLADAILRQANS